MCKQKCNNLPTLYTFCVMIVQTWHSMLKGSKNIVTKTRTMTLFSGKINAQFALFSEKFTQMTRILQHVKSWRIAFLRYPAWWYTQSVGPFENVIWAFITLMLTWFPISFSLIRHYITKSSAGPATLINARKLIVLWFYEN